jgi:hypothetical protein
MFPAVSRTIDVVDNTNNTNEISEMMAKIELMSRYIPSQITAMKI